MFFELAWSDRGQADGFRKKLPKNGGGYAWIECNGFRPSVYEFGFIGTGTGFSGMVDDYDPYREALVLETETIWPLEYEDWEPSKKASVAAQLHTEPAKAANLEYVRLHSGFCRRIYVTPDDLARVQ